MDCDECRTPFTTVNRAHNIPTGLVEDDRPVTLRVCGGCNERRWLEVHQARNTVPAITY